LFKQGERKVNLEALTDELVKLRLGPGTRRVRPLVFFNACGSAMVDPVGASSFPELFLRRDLGFLGFIGTEATIPDSFAAEFARAFYGFLLDGKEIGEALHATRWKLLDDNMNPLGLLYSLYAEPEIRVWRTDSPLAERAESPMVQGPGRKKENPLEGHQRRTTASAPPPARVIGLLAKARDRNSGPA
jgi:hypothetical protein